MEIERKFLIPSPPEELDDHPCDRVSQGYLAIGEHEEVRLRAIGDSTLLTVKRGRGEVREEQEIELGRDQFDALWPLTEGRRIDKLRYRLPDGDREVELDVYEGELEGLITAEIESESERESASFEPPAWFGDEVTDDDRYKNEALASDGMPE